MKAARHQSLGRAIKYVYESLAEQKRDQTMGNEIFLSTVHSDKGLDFPHVFVAGACRCGKEEERRAYYVAMTRARETLCLFDRKDRPNIHTRLLKGNFLLRREPTPAHQPDEQLVCRRYGILGMADLFLDYAGRRHPGDAAHKHLAALTTGDELTARATGNQIELHDARGSSVAVLSRSACETWKGRLAAIKRIRVLAMVERRSEDCNEEFRVQCKCDQWEIPLAEITYRAG